MPPGTISSSILGGAGLKHPIMNIHWWTPAGFTRKKGGSRVKHLPLRYARVWLYTWNEDGVFVPVNDEPTGIVLIRDMPQNSSWIKVGRKWFQTVSGLPSKLPAFLPDTGTGKRVAYLSFISQPEYETDLAFGLFKKLRVTYRPVRTFINRHRRRLRIGNLVATCFTAGGCFQWIGQSNSPWDFWMVSGIMMAVHAMVSMIWIVWDIKRDKKVFE